MLRKAMWGGEDSEVVGYHSRYFKKEGKDFIEISGKIDYEALKVSLVGIEELNEPKNITYNRNRRWKRKLKKLQKNGLFPKL